MVIGSVFLDVFAARPKKETRWCAQRGLLDCKSPRPMLLPLPTPTAAVVRSDDTWCRYPLLNCRLPTSPDLCIELERSPAKKVGPEEGAGEAAVTTAAANGVGDDAVDDELVTVVGNGEQDFVITIAAELEPTTAAHGGGDSAPCLVWIGRKIPLRVSSGGRWQTRLQLRSSAPELKAFFANLVPQQILVRGASADVSLQGLADQLGDDVDVARLGLDMTFAELDDTRLRLSVNLAPGSTTDPAAPLPDAPPKPAGAEVLALVLSVQSVELLASPPADAMQCVLSVFCPGQPRLRFTAPFRLADARKPVAIGQDIRFELPGLQPTDIMPWLAQHKLQFEAILICDAGFSNLGRGSWDPTPLLIQAEEAGCVDIMASADGGASISNVRWGSVMVSLRWEFVPWDSDVPADMVPAEDDAWEGNTMPHIFNIGVDLRSIQDLQNKEGHVFLKYTCPPVFGSNKQFHTHMITPRKVETLLPHSYAMYELLAPRGVINAGLREQPLLVELWRRSGDHDNDVCVGVAAVSMRALAGAPATKSVQGSTAACRKMEQLIDIVSPTQDGAVIGRLRVALTLDDFGVVADGHAQASAGPVADDQQTEISDGDVRRDGMEYEAAWQVEMWKRNEEARWEVNIRFLSD
jgi:hypothetical protein